MPNLNFQISGLEANSHGLTPLIEFRLRISALPEGQSIAGLLLNAQIQFECPQRPYSPAEKEKLVELFGTPDRWGQTLRNRLWTHANTTIGAFTGSTEAALCVPCTYDLNVAATKYLYGLDDGEVSLLFLFSGSVFYSNAEGRLQVERISWNKESQYRFPVQTWRELMDRHYPNSSWLTLRRDVFDKLYEAKRRYGLATWDELIERLLREDALEHGTVRFPDEVPA